MEPQKSLSNKIESFEDFVVISTTKSDELDMISQKLNSLKNKIAQDQSGWFPGNALEQDFKNLTECLNEYHSIKLTNEDKPVCFLQLCTIYKVLNELKNSQTFPYLSQKLRAEISAEQTQVNRLIDNSGNDLINLLSLIGIGEKLSNALDLSELCVLSKDKSALDIQPVQAKSQNDTNAEMNDYLKLIMISLQKDFIINKLTISQIFQLKFIVVRLSLHYLLAQEKYTLCGHIGDSLNEINDILTLRLKNHPQLGNFVDCENIEKSTLLNNLPGLIEDKIYFKEFWLKDGRHIRKLNEYEKQYQAYSQALSQSEKASNLMDQGLQFIGKDFDKGLLLYKNEKDDIVVFSLGHENLLSHYNPAQNRDTLPNMGGGLTHAPIAHQASLSLEILKQMISSFQDTLDENSKRITKIITVGFGLDGAIAQILAYDLACSDSKIETESYCTGTPPFLDLEAAETVGKQKNHYALNFELIGDRQINVSGLSHYVANKYSKANFKASYPVYNHNWFVSDGSGHNKSLYLNNGRPAVQQPQKMYKLYHEMVQLGEIFSSSNKDPLGRRLVDYYKN
jgi:hypothetical protein